MYDTEKPGEQWTDFMPSIIKSLKTSALDNLLLSEQKFQRLLKRTKQKKTKTYLVISDNFPKALKLPEI